MSAVPAVVPPDAPAARAARIDLFVSTALDFWPTEQGAVFARDVQIDDTAYRRLDPEYYAWLRSRMMVAKKAAIAGQLYVAAFDELRGKFNAVHEWAVEHFGKEKLRAAMQVLVVGEYKPPMVVDCRAPTSLPRAPRSVAYHLSPEAIALVESIVGNAMARGWNRERLYSTGNGTFDPRRGLVCFLKPGDRIGEITLQFIEIIHPLPSEVRHRFYNPDAAQPWIKKSTELEKSGNPT